MLQYLLILLFLNRHNKFKEVRHWKIDPIQLPTPPLISLLRTEPSIPISLSFLQNPPVCHLHQRVILKHGKNVDFYAPLTAFRWNEVVSKFTSLGKAKCETGQVVKGGMDIFTSDGADGSVQMIDLRQQENPP
ncbi:unnamed protein product [Clavelina lepadiformis]|uniref:Uncharacterized protein n=1 Tax=Clavelina lepadiformis TaxID=159417 RepID=A0ABP0FJX1_CLALP